MMEISRTDCGVSGLGFCQLELYRDASAREGKDILESIDLYFWFSGTLLTLFVVTEGGERAYGVDMPRKSGT